MQIQSNLASTIAMAFDECPSSVASREYVQSSVERTTRWLHRCKAEMQRLNSLEDTINPSQMLFGINQGAVYEDIRIEHAKEIAALDLDGYAVGGLAVGESHEEMYRILDAVVPHLPENKPTYLMGVGTPANILEAVERGVDFFRLRVSQPERTSRTCVHQPWKVKPLQCKIRAGWISHRGGVPVPGMPPLQQGLHPPSAQGKRDAGYASVCAAQFVFLQSSHGRIRGAIDAGKFQEYKRAKLEGLHAENKKY